ncbi:MAG: DNA-processing protein DprA [Moraxella sp.]|nr:DNA-processing protein DprA [Moraxella sp.]
MKHVADNQSAVLALWFVVNASLSSYHKLVAAFGSAKEALSASADDWQALGIHQAHRQRLQDSNGLQVFLSSVAQDLKERRYQVLLATDDDYPAMLHDIYDPPPILFYQGDSKRLNEPQIAIVGSRKPTSYAEKVSFDLAQYLAQCGYVITSGLADGVDRQAHLGAMAQHDSGLLGRTVGVMGTGIDVCYPKANQGLFADIVQTGGCLVTELLPKTPASKFTFPRRNRLVAGLSLATIVTEAALQSGSLITARLTAEQGKQVFAVPSRIDNPNAEGCHHLIREGATLIYHPTQILDEIQNTHTFTALPKTFSQGVSEYIEISTTNDSTNPPKIPPSTPVQATQDIPKHLQVVYDCLENNPQDLDTLVVQTGLPVGELLAKLTELEIFGFAKQMGGRYGR